MSIAALKRQSQSVTAAITKALNDAKSNTSYQEENFWKPYIDPEKGIGQAIIRFLPAPDGEELPFVKVLGYSVKNHATNRYYINNSRMTLHEKDPVNDLFSRLWNAGNESDKELAKTLTRNTNFISNILVINDPARPENNGKVFKYKYGQTVFEAIDSKMAPKFIGEQPVNPFDLWTGCNFKIRIYLAGEGKKKLPKYDRCEWDVASELFAGDDAAKEAVWKQCESLAAFLKPEKFKSYAELSKQLLDVLGPRFGSVSTIDLGDGSLAPAASVPVSNVVVPVATAAQQPPAAIHTATVNQASEAPWESTGDPDLDFFTKAAAGKV